MFESVEIFISLNTKLDLGLTVLAVEVVKVFLKLSEIIGEVSISLVILFVSSLLHTNLIMNKQNTHDYYYNNSVL